MPLMSLAFPTQNLTDNDQGQTPGKAHTQPSMPHTSLVRKFSATISSFQGQNIKNKKESKPNPTKHMPLSFLLAFSSVSRGILEQTHILHPIGMCSFRCTASYTTRTGLIARTVLLVHDKLFDAKGELESPAHSFNSSSKRRVQRPRFSTSPSTALCRFLAQSSSAPRISKYDGFSEEKWSDCKKSNPA
mmetsp:Transcript_40805/g.66169  ORF Transcript_40805/g.66169 Transcript_40805/m.66169 type:complete len:189 (+) Transcript_40805:401-967(+)